MQSGRCRRRWFGPDVIWLLSVAEKFVDLVDEKVEGSRPNDKIQSSRSPRTALIDEG
jgi:hypothetical protein